jgi:hypothetical protein
MSRQLFLDREDAARNHPEAMTGTPSSESRQRPAAKEPILSGFVSVRFI